VIAYSADEPNDAMFAVPSNSESSHSPTISQRSRELMDTLGPLAKLLLAAQDWGSCRWRFS
jgi:hypothetical protein